MVREMLPRHIFWPEELLRLLEAEQTRNHPTSCSRTKRRATPRASRHTPPLSVVVILEKCLVYAIDLLILTD